MDKNGIKHVFIPAYHSASNGQAERSVQIVKKALKTVLDVKKQQKYVNSSSVGEIPATLPYNSALNNWRNAM
jgi:hypothetical protein